MAKPAQFLTDHRGEKVAVVINLKDYQKLMDEIEELEAIRAYDAAKAAGGKPVPMEKVFARIERRRK